MFIEKTLEKFTREKTYKYFPGNSIIHFINDVAIGRTIISIKDEMEKSGLFNNYVFLPTDSYHMTVCDLITYNNLHSDSSFESFVFKDYEDLEIIDQKILELLETEFFKLNVEMKMVKITTKQIRLEPRSKKDEQLLIDFRKMIEKKLKIRINPDYHFHISLTYQLKVLDEAEEKALNAFMEALNNKYINEIDCILVDQPVLTVFNDMYEYRQLSKGRTNLGYSAKR